MAPPNAYIECWVGSLKKEILNHIVCFSPQQTDYVVDTWVEHYNKLRPHQGKGRDNVVLDEGFVPMSEGTIRCRRKLGGIVTEYYREAA